MKLRAFLAALLALSLCASPALAAWSVTSLGANGNAQAGGATSVATGSITIPANALGIVGGLVRRSSADPVIGVADSAGNNWTVITCTSVTGATTSQAFIAYFRYGGTGLTAGTVTLSDTAGSNWTGAAMSASYATGHLASGTVEDSAGRGCPGTPNGNSTSPSVTSGSATASGNLAFGVTARFGTSASFSYTVDSVNGWTVQGATGNTNVVEETAYAINASAGAITLNPTMNSATWTQQIVQFFAEPAASTGIASRQSLLGVGR